MNYFYLYHSLHTFAQGVICYGSIRKDYTMIFNLKFEVPESVEQNKMFASLAH